MLHKMSTDNIFKVQSNLYRSHSLCILVDCKSRQKHVLIDLTVTVQRQFMRRLLFVKIETESTREIMYSRQKNIKTKEKYSVNF